MKNYKIRYKVEDRNRPPEEAATETEFSNVKVSTTDHGYTDYLFAASILYDDDGEIDSILLLDSGSDTPIPRRHILEAVKEQIEHCLENHCKKE